MRPSLGAVLSAAALFALTPPCGADVVVDWNEVLLDAIRTDRTTPPKAGRAMAAVHVSIFDAVNGIVGGYTPYHVTATAPFGASPGAAAAAAAHRVLTALYPAQQAAFDEALAASLAVIQDGFIPEGVGVGWGESVADQILALRANDHSADVVNALFPIGGSWWTPTPPAFAPALLPNWPRVTPWTLTRGSQLRQGPPPALGSADYTTAFLEVERLGRSDSAERTPDQTQIALFWSDGSGTATPPGHWLAIASAISTEQHLPLHHNARLFALLGLAAADAAIVSWDHKYYYDHWRPVTGIQHADLDGNPHTAADPAWLPLIATPPFPAYTSGHSTFSAASARILGLFFGTDVFPFSAVADALPGVQRSFTRFSQAAAEAGQSRIYGGIHWAYDNQVGLQTGRTLAEHVFFSFLTPLATPGACLPGADTACLNNGRFSVEATWRTASSFGPAHVQALGDDSAQFWFFDQDNTELVVKVLNACGLNQRYWVFSSGLTNVEVLITVIDTQAGRVRQYFNPLDQPFVPVQDVSAFATCP